MLDGSGFPRKSRIFAGNVSEGDTLEAMLTGLGVARGTIVVMDAGIASEENISWLKEHHYRYLVVSRQRKRDFDENAAITVKQTTGQKVQVQRVIDNETGETKLYCHSEMREKKEQAIQDRFAERFEQALQGVADGLHKKGRLKRYEKVLVRIGRMKEKYAGAAQHYEIKVVPGPDSDNAKSISWTRKEKSNTQATHPGYGVKLRLALVGDGGRRPVFGARLLAAALSRRTMPSARTKGRSALGREAVAPGLSAGP